MSKRNFIAAAVALSIGLSFSSVNAQTFRAATWVGVGSQEDLWLINFANSVKAATNGRMTFDVFSGGALLPVNGSLSGLGSGVAQVGNITAAYIPADLPMDAVASDVSFITDDQMAVAFARTEVGFFNKQLVEELRGKGVIFVAGFDVGTYNLMCRFEANSLADFKGKKIRAVSKALIDYITLIGGVTVTSPSTEVYTGFQRGTIDCSTGVPLHLTSYGKLHEVAKSVYRLPLGSNTNGGFYFNQDFWEARTPVERRILLKAASRAEAIEMVSWAVKNEEAWQAGRDSKVKLVEPEPAAVESLNAFKRNFLVGLGKQQAEKRNIKDPTELINEFVASYERWKKLLATVDRKNVDAVTALLDREIFDKVDVATYGIRKK